jgi:hypothetical protein
MARTPQCAGAGRQRSRRHLDEADKRSGNRRAALPARPSMQFVAVAKSDLGRVHDAAPSQLQVTAAL